MFRAIANSLGFRRSSSQPDDTTSKAQQEQINEELQASTIEIQTHLMYCLENQGVTLFPAMAKGDMSSLQNEKIHLMRELMLHSKSFTQHYEKLPLNERAIADFTSQLQDLHQNQDNGQEDQEDEEEEVEEDEEVEEEEEEDYDDMDGEYEDGDEYEDMDETEDSNGHEEHSHQSNLPPVGNNNNGNAGIQESQSQQTNIISQSSAPMIGPQMPHDILQQQTTSIISQQPSSQGQQQQNQSQIGPQLPL